MRSILFVLTIFLMTGLFSAATDAQIRSVYTDIYRSCNTIENGNTTVIRRCPGVGGYTLLAGYYDERFDISIVTPAKKEFLQNYKSLIEGKFSDQQSAKAEWRVKMVKGKMIPFALIVRLGVQDDSDVPKETSTLVVSKISDTNICITDKILPGPNQNELARMAADASSTKPCLL